MRSNAASTPALAQLRDKPSAYIITPWRYHGHRGRGTTITDLECGSTTQGAPKCVALFIFYFSLFFLQNSVRRRTCRTHDATAREGQRPRRTLRWFPLRTLNLLNTPFRGLPLEGDAFNSSNPLLSALFLSFRTHSISSRIKCSTFCP